jgi:hypothetical protein
MRTKKLSSAPPQLDADSERRLVFFLLWLAYFYAVTVVGSFSLVFFKWLELCYNEIILDSCVKLKNCPYIMVLFLRCFLLM